VKPLKLLQYLLRLLAPPGGGIGLDPVMGSGSTLVAAYRLGLAFIGIEIEEPNCEIAARRLRAESRQRRLVL
jgi:DNA modification methylase